MQQGEFSLRGDILDIFEIDQLQPYRIEFSEMRIDGIRIFDPESQRSVENVEKSSTEGSGDLLLQEEDFIRGRQPSNNCRANANEEFKSYLAEILEIFLKETIRILENLLVSFTRSNIPYSIISLNTLLFFLDDYQKNNESNSEI